MMATKEQEMAALKKIRKIVEGLGENSYIGTAFEGCFEIAEENIENDFACSMKQRWESAEQEAEHFRGLAGRLTDQLAIEENRVKELEGKVLDLNTIGIIRAMTTIAIQRTQKMLKHSEEDIIEYSDRVDSQEFQVAVLNRKESLSMLENYESVIGTLNRCSILGEAIHEKLSA